MKIKKLDLMINKIKFKDNYNLEAYRNTDRLYRIQSGIYMFDDKPTMLRFMKALGITCGCERRLIKNKIEYFYNYRKMNLEQKEFLANRARALESITDMTSGIVIKNDCKCKKRQE